MANELWVPSTARDFQSQFKKTPAPRTGPSYGSWSGRDYTYLQMPGGAVMAFDLSKLTMGDFRQMRTHYQINAATSILMFMIHQQDWTIECESTKISEKLDTILRPAWTKLVRALSQSFWAGYSPSVIEYDNDGPSSSVIISKVKDLVPEECRVNWKVVEGVATQPNMTKPRMYEYDGIAQWGAGMWWGVDGTGRGNSGGSYVIPPEYTLWYPMLMENGDYYGRKLLKPAFVPWFFSNIMHLFANRYFERFGEPVPIGRADFEAELIDKNGNEINGRDAMLGILTDLRNRGVVVLPSDRTPIGDSGRSEYDFDIQYLESQMRGADFERYLMRLDEEISLGLFTPISSMRVGDTGAHNAVQVHMQVYLWMLNALTGDMKEYIDAFLIDRLKEFNFGTKAPKAFWQPRKFGKDNLEMLRFMVQSSITAGLVKPDVDELGTAIGLKLTEVQQLTAPPAAPGAPGPTTPGQDPRVGRQNPQPQRRIPTTGDSRVIRSKMAARVAGQFSRAKRDGDVEFTPDFGHRRQWEAFEVHPADLDAWYRSLDLWARDVYSVCNDTAEFQRMAEVVLDEDAA